MTAADRSSAASPGEVVAIDTATYLDIPAARRIRNDLRITVVERAFRPEPEDIQADWVATVAAPAFRLIGGDRARPIRSFAAIGTGVGLDALAAVELLGATTIGVTDLFPEVVEAARRNILDNLAPDTAIDLHARAGDLLAPFAGSGIGFDLIYENLPNILIDDADALEKRRTSSSFVPPRTEAVPQFARDWMLALHHIALGQAREHLNPGGAVLSTLGGRAPLEVLARLATDAGLEPSFLTYTWKAQAEAQDVIGGYAALQAKGYGPFHFYRAATLAEAFAGADPAESGRRAFALEKDLAPWRLDAVAAFEALQRGERIGHTVAVLRSELR